MRCYFPLNLPQVKEQIQFTCPKDSAELLMNDLRYLEQEEFWCIALSNHNKFIDKSMITRGSTTGTVVHPREIYRFAILSNATAIIVAHNHPSGNTEPSNEDKQITKMLYDAGKVLGIPLLDHIIIGDGEYYSFQEAGTLKGDD